MTFNRVQVLRDAIDAALERAREHAGSVSDDPDWQREDVEFWTGEAYRLAGLLTRALLQRVRRRR